MNPDFRRRLRKVGVLLHKSSMASNIIIARVNEYLEPGTRIVDEDMRDIGVIIEVFGPVNRPYARIRIEADNIELVNGKPIFAIIGERKNVKWKKMPKYRRKRGYNRRYNKT